MHGGGSYYTHPFVIWRDYQGGYAAITALCRLYMYIGEASGDEKKPCVLRVVIGKTKYALQSMVESQLYSSTYSIEYLNRLVKELHGLVGNKEHHNFSSMELPCIVNWATFGEKYRVYMIYALIDDDEPWMIASFTNKLPQKGTNDNGHYRIGFIALVPKKYGLWIKNTCLGEKRDLILEVVHKGGR